MDTTFYDLKYTQRIQEYWNNVYDQYDKEGFSVWREHPTPFFVDKIEYLKYKRIKKLLDAGCGDGRNLLPFVEAGFSITGVDISDSAIKICEKKFAKSKNVLLKQILLEELDLYFEPKSFDGIICDFTLAHLENENLEKALDNFYKLLKPDGYILLEFTSPKASFFGQGKRIKENQYIQKGAFLRFFTIKEIENLLKRYKIFFIDSQYYTDPYHGKGYHRKDRHMHHSYFVIAQK